MTMVFDQFMWGRILLTNHARDRDYVEGLELKEEQICVLVAHICSIASRRLSLVIPLYAPSKYLSITVRICQIANITPYCTT